VSYLGFYDARPLQRDAVYRPSVASTMNRRRFGWLQCPLVAARRSDGAPNADHRTVGLGLCPFLSELRRCCHWRTWAMFRTLGIAPALGRDSQEDEDRLGSSHVLTL
jgi:hypothetical protein